MTYNAFVGKTDVCWKEYQAREQWRWDGGAMWHQEHAYCEALLNNPSVLSHGQQKEDTQ